jgi:hypothetical protein
MQRTGAHVKNNQAMPRRGFAPAILRAMDVTDTIVTVTARVLGWTEARVRGDRGRYAAFQRDDAFAHDHVDWSRLAWTNVGKGAAEGDVYGRRDIDVARSLFGSKSFTAQVADLALRPVFKKTPALYGSQVQEIVAAGRIETFAITKMTGRIVGGDTLVEAMTSLLALGATKLRGPRKSAVHPTWQTFGAEAGEACEARLTARVHEAAARAPPT